MRPAIVLVLPLASLAVIAACSGGGGGGGGGGACVELTAGGTITSGTYVASCWDQVIDECAVLTSRNGQDLTVTVTGTGLQIGLASGTVVDSSFGLQSTGQIDFSTDPYGFGAVDCLVATEQALAGIVKGNDVADLVETQDVNVISGAECDEAAEGVSDLAGANISLPCHSEAEFRMTKTGP